LSYLDETDVGALLAEALTADVEAVLADETSGVGADAAVEAMSAIVVCQCFPSICQFPLDLAPQVFRPFVFCF